MSTARLVIVNGDPSTRVQCCVCHKMKSVADVMADLNGEAYKAYICHNCLVSHGNVGLITANHALRDAIETFLDEADDTSVIPISEAIQNLRERYGKI